jgi:hypothetical protein
MHRSGTSLVARVLNLLGVSLGPEDHMLSPTEHNPSGFWEHASIVDFNDEILARLGGKWHDPPELPHRWHQDARFDDLKRSAAALVRKEFGESELWGWKDPRSCLTLPFWRTVAPPTHYVLCVRNPVDVARSLRHTMSFEAGVSLWLLYVRWALMHTGGRPRMFVFYEDLMSDPQAHADRLAGFIGEAGAADRPEVQDALSAFVTENLWHHRTPLKRVVYDRRVAFEAKALYLAIRLKSPEPAEGWPDGLLEAFGRVAVEAGTGAVKPKGP